MLVALDNAIERGFETWFNLKSVHIPFASDYRFDRYYGAKLEKFTMALEKASNLVTVNMPIMEGIPSEWFTLKIASRLSANASVKKIGLSLESGAQEILQIVQNDFAGSLSTRVLNNDHTRSLATVLHVDGQSLQEIYESRKSSSKSQAIANSIVATKFDDNIWKLILEYAMDYEDPPVKIGVAGYPMVLLGIARRPQVCLRVMTVCRMFKRLGIPYLYRRIRLTSVDGARCFVRCLAKDPSKALLVEAINLGASKWEPPKVDLLATVFRLCHNIRAVTSEYDETQLTWKALQTICDTSAKNITVFRPSYICTPSVSESISAFFLQSFQNLTTLSWNCQAKFQPAEEGSEALIRGMCPKLKDLEYAGEKDVITDPEAGPRLSLLELLCLPSLPSIKALTLQGHFPEAIQFLKAHGKKITILSVDFDHCFRLSPNSALQYCPSLTLLYFTGKIMSCNTKIQEMLRNCAPEMPHPLAKIVYDSDYEESTYKLQTWGALLDPALYTGFPRLCEIQVNACTWPLNEHEMKLCEWPTLSERLSIHHIKLLDGKGKSYVTRMGSLRG